MCLARQDTTLSSIKMCFKAISTLISHFKAPRTLELFRRVTMDLFVAVQVDHLVETTFTYLANVTVGL